MALSRTISISGSSEQTRLRVRRLIMLAVLVFCGDLLFYHGHFGLSLAVFGIAVYAVHLLTRRVLKVPLAPTALLVITTLPVIEYPQALAIGFLLSGLVISTVWALLGTRDYRRFLLPMAARFTAYIPLHGAVTVWTRRHVLTARSRQPVKKGQFLSGWAVPVIGVVVLVAILRMANPVFDQMVIDLLAFQLVTKGLLWHLALWFAIAVLAWPFIGRFRQTPHTLCSLFAQPPRLAGLNGRSVANALILFNAVLAIQTILDVQYLWLGGTLPKGMTYATYAQRGAYPLLATAMLAGGFALAARPFLSERPMLPWLMMLWLGQNVLLTAAAGYRLQLYVDAYGLTYLRIYAAIWMSMVAIGLVLTCWQIWHRHDMRWLVLRCGVLALSVLYTSCFVNYAAVIAAYNLKHVEVIDRSYLCRLGPTAEKARRQAERPIDCFTKWPEQQDWRAWSFRDWRTQQYLERSYPLDTAPLTAPSDSGWVDLE